MLSLDLASSCEDEIAKLAPSAGSLGHDLGELFLPLVLGKCNRELSEPSPLGKLAAPFSTLLVDDIRGQQFVSSKGLGRAWLLRAADVRRSRSKSVPLVVEDCALGNRLVGILHGCLRHQTPYDEHTAWGHRITLAA